MIIERKLVAGLVAGLVVVALDLTLADAAHAACPTCGANNPAPMAINCNSSLCDPYLWRANIISYPRVFILYWGWNGGANDPNNAREAYLTLLEGNSASPSPSSSIGGTRWLDTVTQYYGNDNWYPFGSPTYPTSTYADTTLNLVGGVTAEAWDDNLAARPVKFSGVGGAPDEALWAKTNVFGSQIPEGDGDAIIIIAFPNPGNGPCPWCSGGSDHTYTVDNRDPTNFPGGVPLPLARIQYGQQANESATSFHEVSEIITDPDQATWFACGNSQCELGDLCNGAQNWAVRVGPQTTSRVQTLWSNEANACVHGRATDANLFVVGQDQHLWQQYSYVPTTITQYNYTSWGAPNGVSFAYSKPATVSWGPQRIDNFVGGTNNAVYHAWSDNGGYSVGWESLGAPPLGYYLNSGIDAASWGFSRLDAFVNVWSYLTGNRIWHKAYDSSGWSAWQFISAPNGVTMQSAPAAASWGTWDVTQASGPRVDIFQIMSDGNLWQATATDSAGSSFSWQKLGALPYCWQGDPDVAAGFDMKAVQYSDYERWDVFVRDCNGNLWDGAITQDVGGSPILQGWASWGHPASVPFIDGPSVTGLGDGRFVIAAKGNDLNAYMNN